MAIVGAVWRHGGQQGVTGRNGRQGVVLQFTGPGASVRTGASRICGHLVEGDGAVVEVQRGGRGHVRADGVLVQLCRAVSQNRLLFNGSGHQLGRAH